MKKILALILSILMLIGLSACAPEGGTEIQKPSGSDSAPDTAVETQDTVDRNTHFNITVISGTTGMGFAKMMDDAQNGTALFPYNFEIVSGADVAQSAIVSGSADIAAVPTNLAAALYAKTEGEIQILAANTLGVLYLIENGNTVNNISDLAGKTIYCCQQGANPEYITSYILKQNGFEVGKDVFLDFTYNSPDELATAVAEGLVNLAVLPEPKVTATLSQNTSLRRALNFSTEWENATGGLPLIQGCIIARKSFVEENPAEIELFLREYETSIEFTNRDSQKASELIAAFGIIPKAPLALKAIPNCNIHFISGTDLTSPMMSFFNVLYEANPKAVGNKIPDYDIFFSAD